MNTLPAVPLDMNCVIDLEETVALGGWVVTRGAGDR